MSARVQRRRVIGAGVCLATVGAFAGGCAAGTTAPGGLAATSPAPASPRGTLVAAVPGEKSDPYRFTVAGTDGLTVSGAVDPAVRGYRMQTKQKDPDLGFTLTMTFLVVDQQSWLKASFSGTDGLTGLPKLPKTWMLLDRSKIKGGDAPLAYEEDSDPGNAGVLMESIVDVAQTAPGSFAGTLDLTRRSEAEFAEPEQVKALGDKARAVPFEATVDRSGRLTSAVIRFPAAGRVKASRYAVTYTDYGTDERPAVPAADAQQKAPAVAYEMLNG